MPAGKLIFLIPQSYTVDIVLLYTCYIYICVCENEWISRYLCPTTERQGIKLLRYILLVNCVGGIFILFDTFSHGLSSFITSSDTICSQFKDVTTLKRISTSQHVGNNVTNVPAISKTLDTLP